MTDKTKETKTIDTAPKKKKSAAPKKRHPLLMAYLIVGAVLLVVLIAATVIAAPWVKPIEAEQPNPPAEETLAAVKATEGEKIAIEIPLADNEEIKSAEGASLEDGGIFFTAKTAGEKTVTVVTEEKEGPKAPETNFFGRLRALLRGVIGIAPDEYRTEKAEIASYTIPITVTAAEPQEAQGDALALDFEENPSAILVFNEIPNVTVADGSVAKATVVGYTVVVKPVGEEGGETTIEITADGKKTTYPITVAAKPADTPSGGSSSRPSGGGSGSQSSSQSSAAPTLSTAEKQQAIFNLVNAERAKNGLSPMRYCYEAQAAADLRAAELQTVFSHYRPNGDLCFSVFDELGITGCEMYAENIAGGYNQPEPIMDMWMNSPGHRANILGNYSGIVVGVKGNNWVQIFVR